MYSELSPEPVMSEVELRVALAQYKDLYYPDPVRMHGLDELEKCLIWMSRSANGIFLPKHIGQILMDQNADIVAWMKFTFERMRASAQLFVQLWHFDHRMASMTDESLEAALKSLYSPYVQDDRFAGLFWPKGKVPSW